MEKIRTLAKVNQVAIQVLEKDSEKLVPIKPICEALGVNFATQYNKLKEDDFLNSTVALRATVGSDGRDREMVCLPYEFIFGWLFTINPKNVKEEARDAVARYRIECYRALYRNFTDQSNFLTDKQAALENHIEEMDNIRAEFNTARERMNEAKKKLNKIKEFTFEEWQSNDRQLKIDF